MRNKLKTPLKSFLILLWLLPSLFLFYLKDVNSFFWIPLSNVATGVSSGYLNISQLEQPAYVIIIYSISSISGLSPLQLSYFPIGAIIVPLSYFALSRKLLKSDKLAILLATYLAYDFSMYPGHYNSFAYAWTRPLFLSFLLLFYIYTQNRRPIYVIPLMLIFLTTYHLHPTYTSWIIMLTFFTGLMVIVIQKSGAKMVSLKSTTSLALSFLVIYFGFNQLFYNTYLKKVISLEPTMISEEFISTISTFLGLTATKTEKYLLPNSPPTEIIGHATFLRTLFIIITLLLVAMFWLKKNYKKISLNIDNDVVLIISLFLVGVGHVLSYALYGHMSLRFITLIYPILAVLALKKINARRYIQVSFLSVLVLLAFMQTGSFISENYNQQSNVIYKVRPSSTWMFNKTQENVILSDFDTSQVIFFYFKSSGSSFNQRFYDSMTFEELITPIPESDEPLQFIDYVVINKNQEDSTPSVGWKKYEPLSVHFQKINNNLIIDKVYDGGDIWIFKKK